MFDMAIKSKSNIFVPRTDIQVALLKSAMARPDDEIDTSDSPEWTAQDFARAEQGKFYRPVKAQITAKLDMDVLSWLKSQGPGYQSRMNAILRREMLHSINTDVKHK
jgi:uncharacterized protein (DUF4415 family)